AAVWKISEPNLKIMLWKRELLDAALAVLPERPSAKIEETDKEPTLFHIEYSDGFQAACYISPKAFNEFAVAGNVVVDKTEKMIATSFQLPQPQRDHFSFLCNHIEKMFLTDLPSYPVERTLLTTGMLAFLLDSRDDEGKRVPTPELRKINYRPPGV